MREPAMRTSPRPVPIHRSRPSAPPHCARERTAEFGKPFSRKRCQSARTAALEELATTALDVLVVGGGVVGAGAALDAVTRGLSVGLVEARDWASGTSSRSSKLVHGGLRYLEMLDFRLVAEALRERSLLLNRLAPHLVRPVSFLYPLTGRGWERPCTSSRRAPGICMAH